MKRPSVAVMGAFCAFGEDVADSLDSPHPALIASAKVMRILVYIMNSFGEKYLLTGAKCLGNRSPEATPGWNGSAKYAKYESST